MTLVIRKGRKLKDFNVSQAFVELLEEGVNIPACFSFNSKDSVNVFGGNSLAVLKLLSLQVAVAAAINCQSPRFIGGLITTIMKGLWATESAVISANGNEGILNKLWDKANNAKSSIEEQEREVAKSISQKEKPGFQNLL